MQEFYLLHKSIPIVKKLLIGLCYGKNAKLWIILRTPLFCFFVMDYVEELHYINLHIDWENSISWNCYDIFLFISWLLLILINEIFS